ncbi:hypothetical protein [Thermicanus aegyptius]|uniref:hypothetical protein n=1 Tax=Thermicanus aegyptius TaxID=94009 RepID=UPI00048A82B4|nr:hypothetical protein [Thermicanus aegyptius]
MVEFFAGSIAFLVAFILAYGINFFVGFFGLVALMFGLIYLKIDLPESVLNAMGGGAGLGLFVTMLLNVLKGLTVLAKAFKKFHDD